MFRDVTEAFGILSVSESRANYDLLRRKNPNLYGDVSEADFNRANRPDLRDKSGGIPMKAPSADSYAAERAAELAQQRKIYNVGHLGYYNGGVPQKGRGNLRGTALASPGYFHQPSVHNYLENYHQDSKVIDSEDAVKFKAYMGDDKSEYNRTKPFYPAYYDRGFKFLQDRMFWAGILAFLGLMSYGVDKMTVESDRWMRWNRMVYLEDMPAHHFHNRGGVLIKKAFVGFEKYHANNDDLMAWYGKAYKTVLEPEAEKAE